MSNRTCRVCQFWQENDDESGTGQCRRYPPTVFDVERVKVPTGHGYEREEWRSVEIFPDTEEDEWCGEFKKRRCPRLTASE
jgi:hypothetical protein